MWPFSSYSRTPLVIALHNGQGWRARAFRHTRGEWACGEAKEVAGATARQIPKAIFDFAAGADVRRLRVLLSSDIHVLNIALSEDLADEETHTAIAYEAASEIGVDAQMLRLAAVRGDRYRMGGEPDTVLAAGFEMRQIERYEQDCERAGLAFDGAGALEMAVLGRHAREDENRRLLFIRKQTAFYAVPAGDAGPFVVSTLPLGLAMETDATARERSERALKRVAGQATFPLRIMSCGPLEQERVEWFRGCLGEGDGKDIELLAECEPEVLRHAAFAEVGGTESGCAFVGTPPKARDPHRAGTVIFVALLVAALLGIGLVWDTSRHDLRHAEAKMAAWQTLESERKKAKDESSTVLKQRNQIIKVQTLINRRDCLPRGLLPVLRVLSGSMPRYSRITSIRQRERARFEIMGVTQWQEGLTNLSGALRGALREEGMVADLTIDATAGATSQRFTFTVGTPEENK